MSPTERVLRLCRKKGYVVNVVEKWNPFAGKRSDLFGLFDLLAITPDRIIGIQTTSSGHLHDHRQKMLQNAALKKWRGTGAEAWLITFHKTKQRVESVPDGKVFTFEEWPVGFPELVAAEALKSKNKNARRSGKPLVFTEGQYFEL